MNKAHCHTWLQVLCWSPARGQAGQLWVSCAVGRSPRCPGSLSGPIFMTCARMQHSVAYILPLWPSLGRWAFRTGSFLIHLPGRWPLTCGVPWEAVLWDQRLFLNILDGLRCCYHPPWRPLPSDSPNSMCTVSESHPAILKTSFPSTGFLRTAIRKKTNAGEGVTRKLSMPKGVPCEWKPKAKVPHNHITN